MMRRSLLALSSVLVASLAAGCSGNTTATTAQGEATSASSTTTAAATATPAATTIAPQAKGHVRRIADALATVSLSDAQRAQVEQLAQAAETRRQAVAQAHGDLATAVASQIEAGKIDRAALQPKLDAARTAMSAAHPADRAALETLHDLLTPDQRTQLVAALKNDEKPGHGGRKAQMEEWKTDLALSDDQVDQIKTILKASRPDHHGDGHGPGPMGHGHGMLDSFASDHFVMDEPPADGHGPPGGHEGHMLDMVEKVLPILTAQQRVVAASKIRERVQAQQTAGDEAGGPILPF